MKKIYLLLSLVLAVGLFGACNYLDIVPDETATEEDAFKNPKAAERYLYSCYGYIPRPSNTIEAIDFMTGDEVVTAFEHETFAHFPKGNYSAGNPVISYWTTLFDGIRYCYSLIENVDQVPNLPAEVAEDYKAQATFLIGYFHYLLIQNYGPTILITEVEDINASSETFKARTPFDECVKFAVEKLDDAAKRLPATRTGNEFGLATSVAAKAIKAKLLVMAASPLFNGNSQFYSGFNNPDGTPLMPTSFDQSKWDRALAATKEAISAAEQAGFALYYAQENALPNIPEPTDLTQRSLRLALIDKEGSKEIVWGDTRQQGWYDVQPKSAPFFSGKPAWNGVAPTLNMVKRFYTENGLPIDQDPTFPSESEWWVLENTQGSENYEGKVAKFNMHREPRMYAWVAFQNSYYEIGGAGNYKSTDPKTLYHPDFARGKNNGKLVMKMLKNQPGGRGARNNDYSPTGYLNKKLVNPRKTPDDWFIAYIHPYVTISDLYLLGAEAATECNDLAAAKTYLNKIRKRAGIPTVDESWAKAKDPSKANTKEGMRDIVRQERMIELYLTNQNFWDMRRWLLAEKYFSQKPQGMDVMKNDINEYHTVVTFDVERKFNSPRNYLMPIPQGEINKNENLVQNVGY